MEHRREAQRLADGNSALYLWGLITDFKIEETYRNVYTDAKFMEVQRECKRMLYCNSTSLQHLGDGCYEHLIKDRIYVWNEFEKKKKKKRFENSEFTGF